MGYEYMVQDRVFKDCERVVCLGGTEHTICFDEDGKCFTNDTAAVAFLSAEDPMRESLKIRRTYKT